MLNEARDGAQRAGGGRKFHRMGAAWGKALSPYVLSLVFGTQSTLLCREWRAWPGWYTIARNNRDAVEAGHAGLCTWGPGSCSPHGQTQGNSAVPCTQVSYPKTWAWASEFWWYCSGSAAPCWWETGGLHREERCSSRHEIFMKAWISLCIASS